MHEHSPVHLKDTEAPPRSRASIDSPHNSNTTLILSCSCHTTQPARGQGTLLTNMDGTGTLHGCGHQLRTCWSQVFIQETQLLPTDQHCTNISDALHTQTFTKKVQRLVPRYLHTLSRQIPLATHSPLALDRSNWQVHITKHRINLIRT